MLNNYQIKKLMSLADSLDRFGLHKEADQVNNIIKESGTKGKVLSTLGVGALLGGNALLYNQLGITPENFEAATQEIIQGEEIKTELDPNTDFIDYKVKKGDNPTEIGKKHFPHLNEVDAAKLVTEYNPEEVLNLQPGEVLRIPTIEGLRSLDWEIQNNLSLSEPTKMKTSQNLKDWLMAEEGIKPGIYDTKVGKGDLTFGWGHRLTQEEKNNPEKQKELLQKGSKQVFKEDLQRIESIINKKSYHIFKDPTQNQNYFDALISLVYHKGHVPNDIDEAIRRNELDRVPELFLKYKNFGDKEDPAPIFEDRRTREAEIWRSGVYTKKE
jgi:GH24 family phage-related lysozyme (muramidase)